MAHTVRPYTVARAMADYLEDYRHRDGKSVDGIDSVVNRRKPFPLISPHRTP